jgi:hypothetical protein
MAKHSIPSPETLKEQLRLLHQRRLALDRLIHSLERYSKTFEPPRTRNFPPTPSRRASAGPLA